MSALLATAVISTHPGEVMVMSKLGPNTPVTSVTQEGPPPPLPLLPPTASSGVVLTYRVALGVRLFRVTVQASVPGGAVTLVPPGGSEGEKVGADAEGKQPAGTFTWGPTGVVYGAPTPLVELLVKSCECSEGGREWGRGDGRGGWVDTTPLTPPHMYTDVFTR